MRDFDTEWVEELKQQTENHMLYAPLDKVCNDLEKEYEKILQELPEEKRAAILQYVNALNKKNIQLTTQSYLMGIQVGERRSKKIKGNF